MTWTQEQLEIQALAHEFAEGELRGASAQWDGARDLDEQVFGKLAELGFLGMLIPEEYGGLDFDLGTYLLVLEELAWGDASVALSVAIHNGPVASLLRRHGSEQQKQRWLPELASGASLGAFACSAPGSFRPLLGWRGPPLHPCRAAVPSQRAGGRTGLATVNRTREALRFGGVERSRAPGPPNPGPSRRWVRRPVH